jgi:hypothetical protein
MKLIFFLLFLAAGLITAWRLAPQRQKRKVLLAMSRARTQVRDVMRAVQEKTARRKMAWRRAFLDPRGYLSQDGETLMADLSEQCYAFSTTAANKATTEEMLMHEGRRQVWVYIMKQIGIEPTEALVATQNQRVLA